MEEDASKNLTPAQRKTAILKIAKAAKTNPEFKNKVDKMINEGKSAQNKEKKLLENKTKISNQKKVSILLFILFIFLFFFNWQYKSKIGNLEKIGYYYITAWSLYNIYNLNKKYFFEDNTFKEILNSLAVNFIKGILFLLLTTFVLYTLICGERLITGELNKINFHYLIFSLIGIITIFIFEKEVMRNS